MTPDQDVQALIAWILVCAVIAGIGTTAVPILYAFFPWRSRPIGKLFMVQSISFAVAVDLTVIFTLWTPKNILVMFWINAAVFTFVAGSSIAMAWWLLKRLPLYSKKGEVNAPE